MGCCVAAASGRSARLWVMVVGTHNMSVVKGTTSGTRSLLLLPWDLCITLSITSFSGLQKFGASSMQRQWERCWSWFQYFFLHVFFLARVTLLESSSEIPPPALICSHIQHLKGVFMWLPSRGQDLSLAHTETQGESCGYWCGKGPSRLVPAVREVPTNSQAFTCTWAWTEAEH